MKLKHFKGFFKKHRLEVMEVQNVHKEFYTVKLKTDIKWLPGEHGIFTIPGKKMNHKKWRAFSIASIPEEGYIMIATKTYKNVSSFKKVLTHLKPGEYVDIRGPFGWFLLPDKPKPITFLAAGIGITPARSLALTANKKGFDTKLIHVSSHHLFKEDFDKLGIDAKYPTTPRDFHKQVLESLDLDRTYYISGSPNFVGSTKHFLKRHGARKIVVDKFLGY